MPTLANNAVAMAEAAALAVSLRQKLASDLRTFCLTLPPVIAPPCLLYVARSTQRPMTSAPPPGVQASSPTGSPAWRKTYERSKTHSPY